MKIAAIAVEELFGIYNHEIALNLEERITIVHGPNGVGKTVLLKFISSLFAGKFYYLKKTPFSRFRILFDDKSLLLVEVAHRPTSRRDFNDLVASYYDGLGVLKYEDPIEFDKERLHEYTPHLERQSPSLHRVDAENWVDRGKRLSFYQVLEKYGDEEFVRAQDLFIEPSWLNDLRTKLDVYFIETQRLLRQPIARIPSRQSFVSRSAQITSVKECALDLRRRVSETLQIYARESQSRDQDFPGKLIDRRFVPLDIPQLKERMTVLTLARTRLKEIGLANEVGGYEFNIESLDSLDDTRRSVMSLYVIDTEQKFQVFEELSRKIALLLQVINAKFRGKRVAVHDGALTVRDRRDSLVDLDLLSSGEQHELVLVYDLLFRVKENSLVLIDEPELSLHVIWQKSFLSDIKKIIDTASFDVLVATHSPYIAGESSELMVELTDYGMHGELVSE